MSNIPGPPGANQPSSPHPGGAYERFLDILASRGLLSTRGTTHRCPAHEDHTPSLSVSKGDFGVVLYCFAGCKMEDIVAAVGLTPQDLFDSKQGDEEPSATYPYKNAKGETLFVVYRYPGKKFLQRQPNGPWNLKGITRVPYRLPDIVNNPGQPIFIVEGEKDVETLVGKGVIATTNPGGAGKWQDGYTGLLDHASELLIIADDDEPGRKHASEVIESIKRVLPEMVWSLWVPAKGCKDVTDHFEAGHGLSDFRPPERTGLLAGLHNAPWLMEQTFPELQYAVVGLIPEGLTLNVGPPKIGKSWFMLSVAIAVSSGGIAFGHLEVGTRKPVFYLALEDSDRRLQSRMGLLLEGSPAPAKLEFLTRIGDPESILPTVEEWLDEHVDGIVIIDTLGKVMPSSRPGENTYQRDYRIGSSLKALADDHGGSAIIVNHHDRKASADDFIDAVSGTHGLAGAADTVMVLARKRMETDAVLRVTGRDVPEGQYAFKLVGGCVWELGGEDLNMAAAKAAAKEVNEEKYLSARAQQIVVYLDQVGSASPKDIIEALEMPDSTVHNTLAKLLKAGFVTKDEDGKYRLA